MPYARFAVLITLLVFTIAGCGREEAKDFTIPMKAGDYQITVKKIADGKEDPFKKSVVRCYPQKVFDPFKSYHQNKDCKFSNFMKQDNRVIVDFACSKGANANAAGKVEYWVHDEKIAWITTITNLGGNEVDVVTKGTGDYVGKCR